MRLMVVALSFIVVAVAACGSTLPKYAIAMPERHARLPNGMRVILLPDSTSDLVEVDVRYEVGSKEDPEGRAGLAHLVEHLMFQQRQAGPDKPSLGAVLRQRSVYHNAFTNWDSTHYQTLARAEELELLVSLEAARLATGCETITEETFSREREVVRNEIRQRMGGADEQVLYRVLEDVYPERHPYRRMIGGDDVELAAITLADACRFMKEHYVPERATVIIAGKVNEKVAALLVDTYLAPLEARPGARLIAVPKVGPAHKKTTTHELDVDEDSVIVAWPLPARHGEDAEAALFITSVVFGRTAAFGSIYEFASDVEPMILGGVQAPILAIRVGLRRAGDLDEAKAAIFRAAAGAHRGIEDGEFWDEARARLVGSRTMSLENVPARTVLFGDYAQFDAKGEAFGGELNRIRNLDANRLKETVKRVLDPENASIIVVKAKKAAGTGYTRARRAGGGAGDAPRDELPVERSEAALSIAVPEQPTNLSRARRFTLGNGMGVVLLPTQSPVPVLTAKLMFSVGAAHDPPDMLGLAELAADHLQGPLAGERDGGLTRRFGAFSRVGISAFASVEPDNTVFTARGLAIYQNILLEGLEKMTKEPRFFQDGIEEDQRLFELSLRRRAVQSERAVNKQLAEALFGAAHPYSVTAVATAATRKRIGSDELRSFARKHYSAANATLVVAGVFDEASAEKLIRKKFGDWSKGHTDPAVTARAVAHTGRVVLGVTGPETPQVRAHLGYATPAGIDSSHAARLVLVEMLNRRLATVRERLGASYGVYASYQVRRGPGLIEIGGAIDAERGGEALVAVATAIEELRRGEGFIDDFVRARREILERMMVKLSDSGSLATNLVQIAKFGLAPSFADDLVNAVARLTPHHVLPLALRELDPAGEVLVIEGTRAAIDKAFADAKITAARIIEPTK